MWVYLRKAKGKQARWIYCRYLILKYLHVWSTSSSLRKMRTQRDELKGADLMSKTKSLEYQIRGKLKEKLALGVKRHEVKDENGYSPYIHSRTTYKNYVKHSLLFAKWVKKNFGIKNISDMETFTRMYLESRIARRLSAWTVALDAAAIAKLYDCHIADLEVELPKRKRSEIKRSRGRICDFSEKKHQAVVDFCKGTGLRRHELLMLRKSEIWSEGKDVFVFVRQGKGGKSRIVPVRRGYEQTVLGVATTCINDDDKLFNKSDVPCRMPVHKYRAVYAKAQYERFARPIDQIPKRERYICRKDKAGVVYDKAAMAQVSKMLGHNRISVIAESYLY